MSVYQDIYNEVHRKRCVLRIDGEWFIRTSSLTDCIAELGYSEKDILLLINEMVKRKLIHSGTVGTKYTGPGYIIDSWL